MAADHRLLNKNSRVEVLDKEPDSVLFDMVDLNAALAKDKPQPALQSKLAAKQQSAQSVVAHAQPAFKNDYSAHRLNKVYDQIDLDTFSEEHTYIAKRQAKAEPNLEVTAPTKPQKNYSFDMVLDAQDDVLPELEVKTYATPKLKRKPGFGTRFKVFVAAGACVAALFTGLLVYNSIAIGQVSGRLEAGQAALDEQNATLEGVIADYYSQTGDAAVDQAATDLGLTAEGSTNSQKINIKPPREEVQYNVITNFFDKLCNFIASIFGR